MSPERSLSQTADTPTNKKKTGEQGAAGQPLLAPLLSMYPRNYNLNPAFNAGSR
jgi:hypothetical protein